MHVSRESRRLLSKYDMDYFNRDRGTDFQNYRLRKIYEITKPNKGELILDSGCGTGEFLVKSSSVCETVGIDFAKVALQAVRKKATNVPHLSAYLVLGDLCHLPFRNSIFDKVTSADVVEHLLTQQFGLYLAELHRTLKPKGNLILHTMPNKWSINYILAKFARFLNLLDIKPDSYEGHVNLQTPHSLHKYLRAAHFATTIWSTTGDFKGLRLPKRFSLINHILLPMERCNRLTGYFSRDLWAIGQKC